MAECVYLQLFNKDATKLLDGNLMPYNWKWTVPTSLQKRRAPVCFLSIQACYLDDSTGPTPNIPHMLRLKVPSENVLMNEVSEPYINYPIVAILTRDAPSGHWTSFSENNPRIQISSNLNILEFDILDGVGNVIPISSTNTADAFNIMVKLEYPEHNEVSNTIVGSYAQSQVGNPPFNRL